MLLELAGQMEPLAQSLHAIGSVTSVIKYFKILFIYEDYSVISKVASVKMCVVTPGLRGAPADPGPAQDRP